MRGRRNDPGISIGHPARWHRGPHLQQPLSPAMCSSEHPHCCPGCGKFTRVWDLQGRCRECGEFAGVGFFPQAEAW